MLVAAETFFQTPKIWSFLRLTFSLAWRGWPWAVVLALLSLAADILIWGSLENMWAYDDAHFDDPGALPADFGGPDVPLFLAMQFLLAFLVLNLPLTWICRQFYRRIGQVHGPMTHNILAKSVTLAVMMGLLGFAMSLVLGWLPLLLISFGISLSEAALTFYGEWGIMLIPPMMVLYALVLSRYGPIWFAKAMRPIAAPDVDFAVERPVSVPALTVVTLSLTALIFGTLVVLFIAAVFLIDAEILWAGWLEEIVFRLGDGFFTVTMVAAMALAVRWQEARANPSHVFAG